MLLNIVLGNRELSRAGRSIQRVACDRWAAFCGDCRGEWASRFCLFLLAIAVGSVATDVLPNARAQGAKVPDAKWTHGPTSIVDGFPIAVWLQSPANATRYKAAGINLYIGLWKGPTEAQLEALKMAGMPVICAQNQVGLQHKDDPVIVGWMHGDEPDNAQSLGPGKGYGPPILPATIQRDYQQLKAKDRSRPVVLNLGQGVAWDGWRGRGVRTNHPEDYPEYAKGSDIVSFDIYPACHRSPEVAGNLWYVARGVKRLRDWTDHKKPVWCCIECTHISNPEARATPHQVRAEVWMALVHGAQGIIYFSHQFEPKFIEAGLLADRQMLAAVTRLNQQIHRLAPVLCRPTVVDVVTVESSNDEVPLATLVKQKGEFLYVFAVAMRDGETRATLRLDGAAPTAEVEVLGEGRNLRAVDGVFADTFHAWDVHLYKIPWSGLSERP